MLTTRLEDFIKIYQNNIGESDLVYIEQSYKSWIHNQELYHSEEGADMRKRYEYLIFNDYPTAESWITHVKSEIEHKRIMYEAQKTHMAMSWYEREMVGSPIKDIMIKAFIKDEKGIKIRDDLLAWDITANMMFCAIKHFSVYAKLSTSNIIDEKIDEFIEKNKSSLNAMGRGVCADGGRVFRTIFWVCGAFQREFKENGKY